MDPELQDLIKKKQTTLEKIKAAEEILAARKARQKKPSSSWSGLGSNLTAWFLTPLLAGVVAFIFKTCESPSQEIMRTKDFIEKLELDYFKVNDSIRIDIAERITIIHNEYQDPEIQYIIDKYLDIYNRAKAKASVNDLAITQLKKETKILSATQIKNLDKRDSLDVVIRELTQKLDAATDLATKATIQSMLNNAKEQDSVLVKSDTQEKLSQVANNSMIEQIKILDKANAQPASSEVSWFKEGYFLQFEQFQVTLNELNENQESITVSVYDINADPDYNAPLANNTAISFDKPLEFKDTAGNKYRVELKSIGPAGRNPFKPAAYISFTRL